MILIEFNTLFPDVENREMKMREYREKEGVVCPRYGGKDHTWLNGRVESQSKKCGCRISLTKRTVMESRRLPMFAWFFTAHFMTSFKQVPSAKEIQHHLEMKESPPV